MSDQYTRRALAIMKGDNVVYTLYPVVGAGVSIGDTVTQGGANVWGADKELIAALAITTPFWFCQAMVDTSDAAETYVVDIERAGANSIYSFRVNPTAVTLNLGPYGPPFPVAVVANTQVTARCSGPTGGKTINLSILIATGL